MRKAICEYLELTEQEKKDLWKSATFVFDTNVLLNLYRYSAKTRESLLQALEDLKDRIWIPHHVAEEFMKDRYTVISEYNSAFEEIKKASQDFVDKCIGKFRLNANEAEIFEINNSITEWRTHVMEKRFKAIREYFNLTQMEFGRNLNVTHGYITNLESGKVRMSKYIIQSVCKIFSINRQWLLSGEGEMFTETKKQYPIDWEGIPSRLKKVRAWTELSQEKFAKRIKYSKPQVHNAENGIYTPSKRYLKSIINTFHLNHEWLFSGVGAMEEGEKEVDEKLIQWLNEHPEVIRELRMRSDLREMNQFEENQLHQANQ